MAAIDDWAAATYLTLQNAKNMAMDARQMLDTNVDTPGLKAKLDTLASTLAAVTVAP